MPLFVYLDETGKDRNCPFYLVSVLIFQSGAERDKLGSILRSVEEKSGKNNQKWNSCNHSLRKEFLERIAELRLLRSKIFYDIYWPKDPQKYLLHSAEVTAKAIIKYCGERPESKAKIFIDGYDRILKQVFATKMRKLGIRTEGIVSVKKDQNDEFIRLVDSICGLVRDAIEDMTSSSWASEILGELIEKGIVIHL
jgi:hypothetical protein